MSELETGSTATENRSSRWEKLGPFVLKTFDRFLPKLLCAAVCLLSLFAFNTLVDYKGRADSLLAKPVEVNEPLRQEVYRHVESTGYAEMDKAFPKSLDQTTYPSMDALATVINAGIDRETFRARLKLQQQAQTVRTAATEADAKVRDIEARARSVKSRQARQELQEARKVLQGRQDELKQIESKIEQAEEAAESAKKLIVMELPGLDAVARRSDSLMENTTLLNVLDEKSPQHIFFKIGWYAVLIIVVFAIGYLVLLLLRTLPFDGAAARMNDELKNISGQEPPARGAVADLPRPVSRVASILPGLSTLAAVGIGSAVAAGAMLPIPVGPPAGSNVSTAGPKGPGKTSTPKDPADPREREVVTIVGPVGPEGRPGGFRPLSPEEIRQIGDYLAGQVPKPPDITDLEGRVKDLGGKADQMKQDLDTLNQTASGIDNRVYAVEGATRRVNGKVNELDTAVRRTNTDVQRVSSDVGAVDRDVRMSNLAKPTRVWPDWLGRDRYRGGPAAARSLSAYLGDDHSAVRALRRMPQEELPKGEFLKQFKGELADSPNAAALYDKYKNVVLTAARLPR